jgi:hypothetical protein
MTQITKTRTTWLKPSLQPALILAVCIPLGVCGTISILGIAGIPMRIVGNPFGMGYFEWEINHDHPSLPERRPNLAPSDDSLIASVSKKGMIKLN